MADWRFNRMSICICILCGITDRAIVCVDDRKVVLGDFAADGAVWKSTLLANDYSLQFVGESMDKAPLIIDSARRKIGSEKSHDFIVGCLQEAWCEARDREIEAKILRKHGFTFESFRAEGKELCSESVYDQLHDRIDRFKFPIEFMLSGFDERGFPHLNHLDSQGSISCYDELGFWAIGSGAHSALSSLAFHVDKGNLPPMPKVEQAAYFACEAKFMAESSVQVGKETMLTVYGHGEVPGIMSDTELNSIRKKWLKQGAPKPSVEVIKDLNKLILEECTWIKPASSVSQK
jgi:hypothetical protein